jgi:PBP1b-binding outer membrane lipoprotein LpoB
MKRVILFMFIVLLANGCSFENVRHKVGFTTKPFSKNDGFENSTKMNYTIIFGVVRPKEDDD